MKHFMYLILAVFLLNACADTEGLLDKKDTGVLNEGAVYANKVEVQKVLNDLYSRTRSYSGWGTFHAFSGGGVTLLDCATDDAQNADLYEPAKPIAQDVMFANTSFVTGTHPWTHYYLGIRAANLFLKNVDKSPVTDAEKRTYKYEARFLRAFYYFELFRWFGESVLIGDSTLTKDDFSWKRSSIDETVKYISDELTITARSLPVDSSLVDASYYGRATRGAALALKARTLLYAASPLNNPGNDVAKWQAAANALKDVIDLGVYDLYYAPGADAPLSYSRLFNERKSVELIFSYLRGPASDLYGFLPSREPFNASTIVGTLPSQNLVDAYDMKDGKEPVSGYDANFQPIVVSGSGYNPQKPFLNRDPRLDMTIFHHGSVLKLKGINTTWDLATEANFVSKQTGYLVNKYLDSRIDHRSSGTTNQNFPIMRYADILLGYAEALNEIDLNANKVKIFEMINKVRARAGVGLLDASASGWTKESVRRKIIRERRVEFAFEEHRFWDIRRWKLGEQTFNCDLVVSKVTGTLAAPVYAYEKLSYRAFSERLYRFPIPIAEVANNPDIKQNKGWSKTLISKTNK
jgi:hypothetical protein